MNGKVESPWDTFNRICDSLLNASFLFSEGNEPQQLRENGEYDMGEYINLTIDALFEQKNFSYLLELTPPVKVLDAKKIVSHHQTKLMVKEIGDYRLHVHGDEGNRTMVSSFSLKCRQSYTQVGTSCQRIQPPLPAPTFWQEHRMVDSCTCAFHA